MAKKIKWAIGAEPDDAPDFLSNDDIVAKNDGALPPKGFQRVLIKRVTQKENKNGDDMITVMAEVASKGSKADRAWNGYTMWTNFNLTERGAPFLKKFLKSLGLAWNDINKVVIDDKASPAVIVSIGRVKFNKPVEAWVSIRHDAHWQSGEPQAEIGRFLEPVESDEDEESDLEDEELDLDDDLEDELDYDGDDDDDEEDEEEDDDDDELSEMSDAELRSRAKGLGYKAKKLKGKDRDELIDLIESAPPF